MVRAGCALTVQWEMQRYGAPPVNPAAGCLADCAERPYIASSDDVSCICSSSHASSSNSSAGPAPSAGLSSWMAMIESGEEEEDGEGVCCSGVAMGLRGCSELPLGFFSLRGRGRGV